MKDISSILLIIFAILSLGIRLFKKADTQPKSEPSDPVRANKKAVLAAQEEEADMPIPETYVGTSSKTEKLAMAKPAAETPEMPEKTSISDGFDLTKAIVYSEILNARKFDEN